MFSKFLNLFMHIICFTVFTFSKAIYLVNNFFKYHKCIVFLLRVSLQLIQMCGIEKFTKFCENRYWLIECNLYVLGLNKKYLLIKYINCCYKVLILISFFNCILVFSFRSVIYYDNRVRELIKHFNL